MNFNKAEMCPEPTVERITDFNNETFDFLTTNFPGVGFEKACHESFLTSPDNVLFIAKQNGEGAGLIRGHFLHRYDGKGTELLLHELDVVPKYEGQGVATFMVNKLKELAQESGAKEMWVITNRSNAAAMRVYEKTGATSSHNDDVVLTYELE